MKKVKTRRKTNTRKISEFNCYFSDSINLTVPLVFSSGSEEHATKKKSKSKLKWKKKKKKILVKVLIAIFVFLAVKCILGKLYFYFPTVSLT